MTMSAPLKIKIYLVNLHVFIQSSTYIICNILHHRNGFKYCAASMRDADVLEEVVVCETNQVPRCSFAPLVVVVCETKTRSFVFICTHLTATLVDGPCRPGNRECPPIIKESPQLPPIKIKMGSWTNSWKSFQFIFTNAAIERGLF